MFMDITGIDLFDQNVSVTCAYVKLRCQWISLVLILFDQNVGTACANVRLRCLWISTVLIYLIKMWIWHVSMLDSEVY